jgi:succinylarginine dihydrolase
MSGGGGPACLRLRIPIPAEWVDSAGGCRWTEEIDSQLRELINSEYPTSLAISDMATNDLHRHAIDLAVQINQMLNP